MILACKDIHKAYGVETILEKITFTLEEREKMAVVGVNGAGKTTLFKVITGEISHDGGDLYIKKETSLGYLKQNAQIDGGRTIYEEALSVFQDLIDDERELRRLEEGMAHMNGEELAKQMAAYDKLQHSFEAREGYGYKSQVRGVLKGLGFGPEELEKPLYQLSGGEKTRVFLGKLLLSKPELLLLDEPTNHLDIDSINWLEDFLRGYPGAVVIISHDRYFMDKIVTKVVEIENKKSRIYEGNYSFFAKQKEVNRQVQMKQYLDQQKEIKHQEEVIKTLRSFNREKSIKRAESREKNLDKLERVDRPDNLPDTMRLNLSPRITSGNDVLFAEDLKKEFPDKPLFCNVSMDIKRGDKVAIIGPNGVGKSTLFKILLGKETGSGGSIKLGTNVHIGYYDQEQQTIDERKTIFQEIADSYPTLTSGEIRSVLAAFVFEGDDVFKTIGALSGGEKGRVTLAKIMLSKANLLMLDEPTNHLDMYSKEILEDAINRYDGTVVYISHDRYFINRTAKQIFELTPTGINKYLGNYDYYIEKKSTKEREAQLFGDTAPAVKKEEATAIKQDWQSQKEQAAKKRRLQNQISKLEAEIEGAEGRISELEALLSDPAVATDAGRAREVFDEKTTVEDRLTGLMEQWEEASQAQKALFGE